MNCTNHVEKESAGTCVYCGKFFCNDCLVDVEGKNYCKTCVGKAFSEQKTTAQSGPTISINNVNTATAMAGNAGMMVSSKSRLVSLLLCLFLGVIGVHRFYVGKIGTGILYLLTGGFCGIGALIDLILIIVGTFRDSYGMMIKNW